mgnify:CR=1 FL=1
MATKTKEERTKKGQPEKGYKGLRKGSRKETLRQLFDEQGYDPCIKKAEELNIGDLTIRVWIRSWQKRR